MPWQNLFGQSCKKRSLIRVNKSGFAKVPYINRETQPLVFERNKHKAR